MNLTWTQPTYEDADLIDVRRVKQAMWQATWRTRHSSEQRRDINSKNYGKYLELDPRVRMFRQAQQGNRKWLGAETSLQLHHIPEIPTKCPICSAIMVAFARRDQAPSLDRIDSRRGYEPGNVAVICMGCNRRKSDSTIEQLEAIAAYMRKSGVFS